MPTSEQMDDIDQTNFELFWWNPDIVGYTWWMTPKIQEKTAPVKEEVIWTITLDEESGELIMDIKKKDVIL